MASSTRRLTWCCVPYEAPTNRLRPVRCKSRHTRRIPHVPTRHIPGGLPGPVDAGKRDLERFEKRHDRGTLVQAFVIRTPCLQCAARHLKHRSGLTLGDPLGVQLAIPLTQLSAFEASPALVAIFVALRLRLHYCAHS